MGFFSKIFGPRRYPRLEKMVEGKVIPSANSASVKMQLESFANSLPPVKQKAFRKYIEGKSWEAKFVQK